MNRLFTFTLGILAVLQMHAQQSPNLRRCSTMDVDARLRQSDPNYAARRAQIDEAVAAYAANPNAERIQVTIPVVFHVVYRNATQNISDAALQSQIDILNEDFRKLNADFADVPSVFQGVGADFEINFCLATVDPQGNPTTGITRTSTTDNGFDDDDQVKYTAQGGKDAWNTSKYLNFWVCDLSSAGLLGYAQFPGGPAATDGVVITYNAVGRPPYNNFGGAYNLGRTATHEIGHWLNLYHIWGDDGNSCNGSDQVSDTPNQADANYGCPNFPSVSCNNGPNGDMFMNYMDYMDDACGLMFTNGQKTRAQALFSTGGARVGLLTSNACSVAPPPASACNDTLRFPLTGTQALYSDGATGWMAGTNQYADSAKADKFTATAPYTLVKGGLFKFGIAAANGNTNYQVTFRLYGDNGGLPGAILGSTTVPISTIAANVAANAYTTVTFANPIAVTGNFYLGYVVNPASVVDLALYTNTIGDVTTGTAYEQFDNGVWHAYTESPASWGATLSHAISAIMQAAAPTASFTANNTSICAGSTVTYTATATGASSYSWTFPGGNPSSSTVANPTVTYANGGNYNATLVVNGSCSGQNATSTQNNYITVTTTPSTPVISNNNGTLSIGTVTGTIQWFRNGVAINGATSNSFVPVQNGNYTVTVTNGPCSATSNSINMSTVGIAKLSNGATEFFPNPTQNSLSVRPVFAQGQYDLLITIYDLSGKEVLRRQFRNQQNEQVIQIDLSALANGAYQVILNNGFDRQAGRVAVAH